MDKTVNTAKFRKLISDLAISLFPKKEENLAMYEKKRLLSDIEDALSDLRQAKNCFEDARDPEMIEACVYEIKSAEARYNFLLKKAKLLAAKESSIASVVAR